MPLISRNTLSGLNWADVTIMVWSGSLVMLRLGMTTSLNAYDLTALRFGVAAVILAPVALRRGIGTDRLGLIGLAAIVIVLGAPYVLLISLAMKTTPASAAGALNPEVMAIVSVLLGRVIFCDRIGVARLAGLLLTIVGTVMFAKAGGAITTGHLILIGTGSMWACYALIVRHAAIPALNATAIVGVRCRSDVTALIPVVTLGLGVLVLGETAKSGEIASAILVTIGLALILVGGPAMRWLSQHIARGSIGNPHP